jgi:hypothetical protein
MTDLASAQAVEIEISADHRALWVNVDGRCVLRCQKIQNLVVSGTPLDSVLPTDTNEHKGQVSCDDPPSDGGDELPAGQT